MIVSLIKKEFKSNFVLYLVFLSIIAMYAITVVTMYDPTLKESLKSLEESIPRVLAAFGMQNMGETLLDFFVTYLYKFILIDTPFIFSITMCYKLLAKYVGNGSLAYLLNTKHSRIKIALTQWVNLLLGLIIMLAFNTAVLILCSAILFPGALNVPDFLMLNFGLLALQVCMAAFCFMCTCIFNEAKYAIGLGGGVIGIFIILQMLSQVLEHTEFLIYCNPLSLFNPQQLIDGEAISGVKILVLLVFSVIFVIVGLLKFRKKDLPL